MLRAYERASEVVEQRMVEESNTSKYTQTLLRPSEEGSNEQIEKENKNGKTSFFLYVAAC